MSDVTLPVSPQTSFRMVRILRDEVWKNDLVMQAMLEEVVRREARADAFRKPLRGQRPVLGLVR